MDRRLGNPQSPQPRAVLCERARRSLVAIATIPSASRPPGSAELADSASSSVRRRRRARRSSGAVELISRPIPRAALGTAPCRTAAASDHLDRLPGRRDRQGPGRGPGRVGRRTTITPRWMALLGPASRRRSPRQAGPACPLASAPPCSWPAIPRRRAALGRRGRERSGRTRSSACRRPQESGAAPASSAAMAIERHKELRSAGDRRGRASASKEAVLLHRYEMAPRPVAAGDAQGACRTLAEVGGRRAGRRDKVAGQAVASTVDDQHDRSQTSGLT